METAGHLNVAQNGMPQTAFLGFFPWSLWEISRQLQPLGCYAPCILLGVRELFLVSVKYLDQAVKSARAFIPNQVPQSQHSSYMVREEP